MNNGKALIAVAVVGGAIYAAIKYLTPQPVPDSPYFTWEFPSAGYSFTREVPVDTGAIMLSELDPKYIPGAISVVWQGTELWWRPGWPENSLSYLMPGESYTVVTSGACVWNIPMEVL